MEEKNRMFNKKQYFIVYVSALKDEKKLDISFYMQKNKSVINGLFLTLY